MESIKNTLAELTEHFNSKMSEFQKELKTAIPATSPTSNINSQFGSFRSFVLTALENLQLQVELLSRQYDELEMRSRKKILLVHGMAESKKEDVPAQIANLLSVKLSLSSITASSLNRCHRMGRPGGDKPRAILVKFQDMALRDKVWYSKTSLKGSGITLSEFLTRSRHVTFLAARQRFGISKCWTKDGGIVILDSDGIRRRVVSLTELNAIQDPKIGVGVPPTAAAAEVLPGPAPTQRPKDIKSFKDARSKRFVRR